MNKNERIRYTKDGPITQDDRIEGFWFYFILGLFLVAFLTTVGVLVVVG